MGRRVASGGMGFLGWELKEGAGGRTLEGSRVLLEGQGWEPLVHESSVCGGW